MKRVLIFAAALAAFWAANVAVAVVLIRGPRVSGGSGPTLIASIVDGDNGANGGATGAINTTGANFIVVVVADYRPAAIGTFSDSNSNTWTERTVYRTDPGSARIRIYHVYAPTVGSGHTFTYSGTGVYPSIMVYAFSGMASSPYDVENGSDLAGSWTSQATGSITPSQANTLLISGVAWNSTAASAMAADSGFTTGLVSAWVDGVNFGGAAAYKVLTSATAHDVTWSYGGSGAFDVAATVAAFKY